MTMTTTTMNVAFSPNARRHDSNMYAYRTSGRISENVYSFTAEANDNKARFRCEASNIMSQTPLKAEVDLTVMCKYLLIVYVGCFR